VKIPLSFALLVAFASQAAGTCVCVVEAIHISSDGSAYCLCKRYETGDCEPDQPGQCQRPRNVSQRRPKGQWETPEYCPHCMPLGQSPMSGAAAEHANGTVDAKPPQESAPPTQPEGVPVADDFNPIDAKRLPAKSEADSLGFFTLHMKNKIATDIDSDKSVPVGQDIDVKLFRVRLPFVAEDQFIAYEVKQRNESAKEFNPINITDVRYNPEDGDRVLTLRLSHPGYPHLGGKDVYLLRGPK
jgi:hypothetical protein